MQLLLNIDPDRVLESYYKLHVDYERDMEKIKKFLESLAS